MSLLTRKLHGTSSGNRLTALEGRTAPRLSTNPTTGASKIDGGQRRRELGAHVLDPVFDQWEAEWSRRTGQAPQFSRKYGG